MARNVDSTITPSPPHLVTLSSCHPTIHSPSKAAELLKRLHRDQRGTMSIVSVFAVMLMAMLLGMLINSARQVDSKIKMQNAADASAYSGGVVIARGMNSLAFTNHLLCDVFALTAFMREGRDRNAESFVPPVLAAWSQIGPVFASSGFPKFDALGSAISQKVPMEQEMVLRYSEWAAAASELMLPVLEDILAEEQIPEYQRALIAATPQLAQMATAEITWQHDDYVPMADVNAQPAAFASSPSHTCGDGATGTTTASYDSGPMAGVLWRTIGDVVGGSSEDSRTTLPAVDPTLGEEEDQEAYRRQARAQRRVRAQGYLAEWNNASLRAFDREANMSQFGNLWRSFTCGQLEKLLSEHPDTNLPQMIRDRTRDGLSQNDYLEQQFMYVSMVYRKQIGEMLPGLFSNPLESDSQAYAQVMLFVPEPRLIKKQGTRCDSPSRPDLNIGGVPGNFISFPVTDEQDPLDPSEQEQWVVCRQSRPRGWDLWNQNWTCQLVPATTNSMPVLLESDPRGMSPVISIPFDLKLPNLQGLDGAALRRLSTH